MTGSYSVSLLPLLPWPALAALAAAALLLTGYAFWRRARGAWWRLLAFTLAGLGLLQPHVLQEQREPHPDVAIALIDQSPSQSIGEREALRDQALEQLRAGAQTQPNLEWREVIAGATNGSAPGTRLFQDWRRALADVPPGRRAGVVVLTDGQVHDLPRTDETTGPVHVLLTGEKNERDRRLRLIRAPKYGIVGDKVTLDVQVDDLGSPSNGERTTELTVRRDGEVIDRPVVYSGIPALIDVPLVRAGRALIDVSAGPGPAELTMENNRVVAEVNAVRDRLRVLLISGRPHTGERVWRNLLKSDPAVDLVHFTILRPPEKQDATPIHELSLIAFPIRELFMEKLDEFDLIVFDRYTRRGLIPPGYLQNIADYVQNGGALLEAVGPGYADPYISLNRTAIATVMPTVPDANVLEAAFRPAVTDFGQRHPVTMDLGRNEDWGRWFRHIPATALRGQVLMRGANDQPLLVLDRVRGSGGDAVREGRVAQFLSDHIWLWARGYEGGGPHGELLRRLAHWLMKEPELEEEALLARSNGDSITIERRTLADAPPPVRLVTPDGEVRQLTLSPLTPGKFGTSVPVEGQGLYRIEDPQHSVVVPVGAIDPLEFEDARTSPEPLMPAVEAHGGSVHWLTEGTPSLRRIRPEREPSGRGWIGLQANEAHTVAGLEQYPLLPAWLMFLLAAAVLGMTWWREGR
ncbi:MAG TPA: hypothetical protein VKA18_05050 [Alphaproteobacteria bacterium]|nr:hypothetical protein [Alphaproteobacteria bacterium]